MSKFVKVQRGFTLIELMVVIVIIGILVAVALPNFLASQERAKMASVKSNAKILQTVVEAVNIDQGVYPNTINMIVTNDLYKIFENPFTSRTGLATSATGIGAWRTNDDGSLDYSDNSLLNYSDANRSSGLVLYVGLDGANAATTQFNGTGSKTTNTSQNYIIFACDKFGEPIPRFVLTAGEYTPAAQRLKSGF